MITVYMANGVTFNPLTNYTYDVLRTQIVRMWSTASSRNEDVLVVTVSPGGMPTDSIIQMAANTALNLATPQAQGVLSVNGRTGHVHLMATDVPEPAFETPVPKPPLPGVNVDLQDGTSLFVIESVKTFAELPKPDRGGLVVCFVEAESQAYIYDQDSWKAYIPAKV